MSFRNRCRELVLQGWAKLRGREVKIARDGYVDGRKVRAEDTSRDPELSHLGQPAWGDGDEKDIRKPGPASTTAWAGSSEREVRKDVRRPELSDLDDLRAVYEAAVREPAMPPDVVLAVLKQKFVFSHPMLHETLVEAVQATLALRLARRAARKIGHAEDGEDEGEREPLSAEEAQLVAGAAANTINLTLARLFLRLGPPPEGANGDFTPVSSGGGGAQQ